MLPFHPSINYEIQAPEPFSKDVRVDLYAELDRMRHQHYDTDFDFHTDMFNTFKRARDATFTYTSWCYNLRYSTVIPTPAVLITEDSGEQAVYIAPEAFKVASDNFPEQIPVWQAALPSGVTLESLSGAKVLSIDGRIPFEAVDASAELNGDYESLGARQNAFFGSNSMLQYDPYYFGDFMAKPLPLVDNVTLVVQRQNYSKKDTITLPYRSYLQRFRTGFTDSASFLAECFEQAGDDQGVPAREAFNRERSIRPTYAEAPAPSQMLSRDTSSMTQIANLTWAQFYALDDGVTGVLEISMFKEHLVEPDLLPKVLESFQTLKERGVKQMIIDVSNSYFGWTCTAAFFHRLFAGAGPTTIPQPTLDFKIRAGPLAKLIVQKLAEGGDEKFDTEYNSANFLFANQTQMPKGYNYMADAIDEVVNGRPDSFTQRLSTPCDPLGVELPEKPLFDLKNVVILSNGRAATGSAVFTSVMAKKEGVRTVVAGGRSGVPQQITGSIGTFKFAFGSWPLYAHLKQLGLENHPLAPPKPIASIGLKWPLALFWGIDDLERPEKFQDHSPTITFPLTLEMVNNPPELWKAVAAKMFPAE